MTMAWVLGSQSLGAHYTLPKRQQQAIDEVTSLLVKVVCSFFASMRTLEKQCEMSEEYRHYSFPIGVNFLFMIDGILTSFNAHWKTVSGDSGEFVTEMNNLHFWTYNSYEVCKG